MERGRFAPSPTGDLHLGNARTALLAWLWARSAGGGFTLRVEDLDRPRVRPGAAEQQLEELSWLGLDWDEGPDPHGRSERGRRGPYRQSARSALYDEAIDQLAREELVYECFCSRAEVMAASAPHGPQDDGPRYPGTCAKLTAAQREERRRTRAPALRLRVLDRCPSTTRSRDGRRSTRSRRSATSSCAAPTASMLISSPWSWTMPRWASRRSCAARICCPRPRVSSSSTGSSA